MELRMARRGYTASGGSQEPDVAVEALPRASGGQGQRQRRGGERVGLHGRPVLEVGGGLQHPTLAGLALQPEAEEISSAQGAGGQACGCPGGHDEEGESLRGRGVAEAAAGRGGTSARRRAMALADVNCLNWLHLLPFGCYAWCGL